MSQVILSLGGKYTTYIDDKADSGKQKCYLCQLSRVYNEQIGEVQSMNQFLFENKVIRSG